MCIHNYEKKYLSALKGIKKSELSERNKQLILEMNDFLILDNVTKTRILKYLEILKKMGLKLGKDLDQATAEDLKKIISEVQQSDYSCWTKRNWKVIIRRFYKWQTGTQGKDFPPIVDWISLRMSRSEMKLPSEGDLLTEKDVMKLISCADHPRDKAFISVLWESGARIGEIGSLKLKNVVFDEYGKAEAVKRELDDMGIKLDNCVVFGDSESDIPLMEEGLLSIASPEAVPKVVEIASFHVQGDYRGIVNHMAQTGRKKQE